MRCHEEFGCCAERCEVKRLLWGKARLAARRGIICNNEGSGRQSGEAKRRHRRCNFPQQFKYCTALTAHKHINIK